MRGSQGWTGRIAALGLACGVGAFAATAAGFAAPPAQEKGGDAGTVVPLTFTLTLEGKAQPIRLDEPVTLACGDKSHTAVVSCPAVQVYRGHGVTFEYPRTATVTERTATDWAHLTIAYADGPVALVEVRKGTAVPAEAAMKLLETEKADWLDAWKPAGMRGAKDGKTVRDIRGRRDGIWVEAVFAGPSQFCELFALPGPTQTVVLTLGWDAESSKAAKPAFDALAKTFTLTDLG